MGPKESSNYMMQARHTESLARLEFNKVTHWAAHCFALALHPILVDLAEAFPNIQITACADDVVISGPFPDIQDVIGGF
jgi:hypothetical protein